MRIRTVAVVLALFFVAPALHAGDAADEDAAELAKLDGTWRVVRYETDGKYLGASTLRGMGILEFSKGRYRWNAGAWGTVELDPTWRPRRVDYASPTAPDREPDSIGIYQFLGHDFFRDCFVPAGSTRPEAFATRSGDGIECLVYQRIPN